APSRLEDHRMVRLASSRSAAVALKVIAWPCSNEELVVGAVMLMVGRELTTTTMGADALLPPRSGTGAGMGGGPERGGLRLIDGPVPRVPSRLDDHRMAVIGPSSRSLAVPVKVITSPCSNELPVDGVLIDTVGTALTMTVMAALVRVPPESVTEAVTVWVPE